MTDLDGLIDDIRASHIDRLDKVLGICKEPATIKEISYNLFGETHGYNVLLALEEAGAHVEYLYQRGELVVANLQELEAEADPAVQYRIV